MDHSQHDRMIGTVVGGFRLERKLGEGGMSAVYLGVREADFAQRVAVKLLSEGIYDASLLDRFRLEQQALAGLQHPHIVNLIDAGATDEGIPYLAMDYVEGEPLDVYCDARRLSIEERIRLCLSLLEAVDYAHRRFLLHCDLKFSNVLVDTTGTVKLLDFGVSKMLEPERFGAEAGATKATLRPFTPEFASPEQLRMDALSTATDVYSAGVVLYQLLSGVHPHDELIENPVRLLRAICEEEIPAPAEKLRAIEKRDPNRIDAVAAGRKTRRAALIADLSGDLGAILRKALERRPEERYAGAARFAEDLRALLDQRPVEARPATWAYRTSKFVLRRRQPLLAGAVVLLAVVVGAGTWLTQAWKAHASRLRAEDRFRDVRQLTNSLLFDFYDAVGKLPGATPVQESLVRSAFSYLDELSKQKAGDADLILDLGESYRKLGNILGNPYQNNLGKPQEGIDTITRGLELLDPLAQAMPQDRRVLFTKARLHSARSEVRWLVGEPELCLRDARTAVEILDPLAARYPNDYEIQMITASRHEMLADLQGGAYAVEMNMAEAQRHLELAKQYASQAAKADPTQVRPLRGQVIFEMKLADMLALDDPAQAMEKYDAALQIFDSIPEEGKQEYASVRTRNALLRSTGWSLRALGRYGEALERYSQLLPAYEEALRADPTNEQTAFDLAVLLRDIGETQIYVKDYPGCVETFSRKAELLVDLAKPKQATERRGAYAESLLYRGICLSRIGRQTEARQDTARALAILDQESAPEDTSDSMLVRAADSFLIAEPEDMRQPAKALRLVERRYTDRIAEDSYYLMLRADALAQLGRRDEALEVVDRAIGNTTPKVNVNTWNRLHAIRAALLASPSLPATSTARVR